MNKKPNEFALISDLSSILLEHCNRYLKRTKGDLSCEVAAKT